MRGVLLVSSFPTKFYYPLFLLLILQPSDAQLSSNAIEKQLTQLKSAMIVRILNHTIWPDEDIKKQYTMAFIGEEPQLYAVMTQDIKLGLIKIEGKPIIITQESITTVNPNNYDIIYLAKNHNPQISQFANRIRLTTTLLLTTDSDAKRDYMINFISGKNSAHRFEVNRSNIVYEKLGIDTSITLLGGTELDIAKLFRETEHQLQTIVGTLLDKETQLKQATQDLQIRQQQIQQQQIQLQSNRQQINQFKTELNLKEQRINATNNQLNQLNQELIDLNDDVNRVSENLTNQRKALDEQAIKNKEQQQIINSQQHRLKKLNKTINEKTAYLNSQRKRITHQSTLLSEQTITIDNQRKRLWLILGILIGFMTLLIYILKINKDKHKAFAVTEASRAKLLTLADIGKDLTSYLELEKVLEQVYQNLNRVLDANVFLVGILQPESNRIIVPLIVENRVKLTHTYWPLTDISSPVVWCVQNNQEIILHNSQEQTRTFDKPIKVNQGAIAMETIVFQPLCIDDRPIGCLSVQSPEANAYNKDELQLIKTLANFTAVALSNALGFRELESQKLQIETQHQTLIDTQQQLVQSEKFASLGTLTAGIAHEINNPINFAHVGAQNLQTGFTELESFLLEMAADDADPEIIAALQNKFTPLYTNIETIKEGTSRVGTIVKDLRFFTHHDKAEQNTVNINECLHSTVNLIKSSYANVTEIIECYGQLPQIYCYPAKLNQVFMNIIVNASDAIRQKIHSQNLDKVGQITISSIKVANNIVITIKDNGCGMNEETQKRLFEPFYTTKDVGAGTGLGLSISYGIIQEHGGNITITSQLGEGSEFVIELPIPSNIN